MPPEFLLTASDRLPIRRFCFDKLLAGRVASRCDELNGRPHLVRSWTHSFILHAGRFGPCAERSGLTRWQWPAWLAEELWSGLGIGASRPGGRKAMEVRVGGPRAFVWSVPLVFGGFFGLFELAVAV